MLFFVDDDSIIHSIAHSLFLEAKPLVQIYKSQDLVNNEVSDYW